VERRKRVYLTTQITFTMSNKKKTYTKEFKEEAVRLAQKNGNISETARSLGLHDSVLRRWRTELNLEGEQT
jgi:transposase